MKKKKKTGFDYLHAVGPSNMCVFTIFVTRTCESAVVARRIFFRVVTKKLKLNKI